ncbi:MAG: glutaredoxin family protein [Anaerolineae bacterium]
MEKELVVYVRRTYCPYVALARDLLKRYQIPHREIFIDADPAMAQRVRDWTGFYSVPTLIVAAPGQDVPYEAPDPLRPGQSPMNIDRGSMITEPNNQGLENWLHKHGFLPKAYKR